MISGWQGLLRVYGMTRVIENIFSELEMLFGVKIKSLGETFEFLKTVEKSFFGAKPVGQVLHEKVL